MGLETGNYLSDLVITNPTGTDPKGQGDDHLRLIKKAAKQSFPGFTGAISVTGPESGSANTYVVTPATPLLAYVSGMTVRFLPGNANTGASTVTISGLGVKALKGPDGNDLIANEVKTTSFVDAVYDGTRFLMRGPTKEWVQQLALSSVLPGQTGNARKFLTTDGTSASWAFPGISGYAVKTATYPVTVDDREKLLDWTADTAGTFTLPPVATAGSAFAFYWQSSGAGGLTLDPDGAELINGAATYVARAGDSGLAFCDGSAWRVFASKSTTAEDFAMFGDGADGNVTITGSVTLSRDMYYSNLTLSSGAALTTNGWQIFVKNVLDITAAPNGAFRWNGNPANATTAGARLPSGTLGGTNVNPVTGNNSAGSAGSAILCNGGKGGYGGGAFSYGANIPVGAQTIAPYRLAATAVPVAAFDSNTMAPVCGGGTGSTGWGSGGAGNGGGMATGGGAIAIFARIISRGSSTANGSIQAKGANGGNGSPSTDGAGGSGGSGGGWIRIVYRFLTGTSATDAIDVTGGNGGSGGNGTIGRGGNGGGSGEGGRVQIYNINTGSATELTPVAAVAGTDASGLPGGAGGVATTSRISL